MPLRVVGIWAVALLATACSPPKVDWAELAETDIRAAHAMILASHPGPVDPEAPEFTANAENSLSRALLLAAQAETATSYLAAVHTYAVGFRDLHLAIEPTPTLRQVREDANEIRWPGIFIGWRGGVASVTHAEPDSGTEKGDVLVSCDGRSFEQIMRESVFPFSSWSPDLPAAWTVNATQVLRDAGNPFLERPDVCVVRNEGDERRVELKWRSLSKERHEELLRASLFGRAPDPAVREVEPRRVVDYAAYIPS